MKHQHLLLALAALLLSACASKNSLMSIDYFGFKEKEDGRWGLMNLRGEVLCESEFKNEPSYVVNDRLYVGTSEGKYQFYEASENPQVIGDGIKYEQVGLFTGKYAPVLKKDGSIKYIDKNGDVAIDLQKKFPNKNIEIAFNFYNDRALIKMDGKCGAIDTDGKLVVPCKYAHAATFYDDIAVFYEEEDENGNMKWYLINRDGKVLLTRSTETIRPISFFRDGVCLAIINNDKHAIIDDKCKILHKLGDKHVYSRIANGMFIFEEDGSYGLMDTKGEVLIKAKYDNMDFNGHLVVGNIDDEWYLLDLKGKKIGDALEGRPLLLSEFVDGYDSFFFVNKDDHYFIYDADGNELSLDVDIKELGLSGRDYVEAAYGLPEEVEEDAVEQEEFEEYVDSAAVYEEPIDSVLIDDSYE